MRGGEELVLSYKAKALAMGDGDQAIPEAPKGPSIPQAGSVQYGGISIDNAPLSIDIPEWKAPPPPPRLDTDTVLYVRYSDNSREALPPLPPGEAFTEFTVPLNKLSAGKLIAGIDVINENTHAVSLCDLRIHDPQQRNINTHPVETASDAQLSLDGIALTRPTNNIEDLIPGTTVQLKGTSTKPMDVSIEPDREGAKNSIIALVGNYNRLMIEMNVLLRNDESLLRELDYLDKEETTEAAEKMGPPGDSVSINCARPCKIEGGHRLPDRRERGSPCRPDWRIANARRGGAAGMDASRLRGYLEID